jgi:His-Xaa-Ser system protein HxsD
MPPCFTECVLDSKIYSLKAIKNAAYDLMNKGFFTIENQPPDRIKIIITAKIPSDDINRLSEIYKNSVLDHQIRIDIESDYKVLREIIVAQAFEPCDNLKEIIAGITHEG